ncbi:trypsin-like peptidase domain-containing protein [Streptomyces sp. NPDC046876]|uniref:trypsin-like peptidase domain-containing protein n=1 Tax=Streptomyces sp. NPDC046876 TaxID=3155616 RepID=UPI0033F3B499
MDAGSGSAVPSDASVARVLGPDGIPEGAGFRAAPREVITCAHVVAKALGLPEDTADPPGGRVWVDFPLAERSTRVPARIAAWTPVGRDGSGDVAVLTLLEDPPAGAPIARLVEDAAGPDRRVRTFGFPPHRDDGAWSVGWLRGATGPAGSSTTPIRPASTGWSAASRAAPSGTSPRAVWSAWSSPRTRGPGCAPPT